MNSFIPKAEKLPKGHPVKVYYEESALIQKLLLELNEANPVEDFQKYFNIYNQLTTIEKRFTRKENQLFPYLEKHGWNGPSQGMWSFHDNLRDQIRLLNGYNSEKNTAKIIQVYLAYQVLKTYNLKVISGKAEWLVMSSAILPPKM